MGALRDFFKAFGKNAEVVAKQTVQDMYGVDVNTYKKDIQTLVSVLKDEASTADTYSLINLIVQKRLTKGTTAKEKILLQSLVDTLEELEELE